MMEHGFQTENGALRRYDGPGGAVSVPRGVTDLGRAAFFRREDVTAVTLPEGVERVGGSAFAECSALERADLPDTVTELGSWAFCGCVSLKELALPAALRRLEERTFWRCAALTAVSLPEGLESVGPEAFRACAALEELALPSSLRSLGEGTFEGCVSLKAATLPEGVTTVPRRAFRGCRSLKSVLLSPGTERVEAEAFAGCAALREIVFPAGVKGVAPNALEGCAALERIVLLSPTPGTEFAPEGVPLIAPAVPLKESSRTLELTLGYAMARREGVAYSPERQAEYTDYLRTNHSILAPLSLTGCPGLLEALLDAGAIPPEDVDGLLADCPNAEKRTALLSCRGRLPSEPEGLDLWDEAELDLSLDPLSGEEAEARWDYLDGPEGIVLTACRGGEREIYVPARIGDRPVTAVGERAFSPRQPGLSPAQRRAREEITGIYLPYGIRRIGDEAFRDCAALGELLLPEDPESLGRSAFLGTPWWAALPEGCVYLGRILYRYKGAMAPGTELSLRQGIKAVAAGALRDREELAAAELPEGTESIGPMAFYNDAALRSARFPASLREIGEYAFHGCAALEEITFSPGLRSLGDRAFYGCRGLRLARLPGSLSTIGEDAFRRCPELVVRAPAGSFAEKYAKDRHIPFEEENDTDKGDGP